MSDTFAGRPIPRAVLVAAAALIGFSIVLAAGGRMSGVGTTRLEHARAVQARDLRFEDGPAGALAVYEVGKAQPIALLQPGSDGFVRGVLRGLRHDRRLQGIGPEQPLRLTRWADGRLSVVDPYTGREIDLGGFGSDNFGAFARLLAAGGGDR